MYFEWDSDNVGHIARHGVTPEEVEEVVGNMPFEVDSYLRNGEERHDVLGETNSHRVLTVVFTYRGDAVRAITAHTAKRKLRTLYKRLKEEWDAQEEGNTQLRE